MKSLWELTRLILFFAMLLCGFVMLIAEADEFVWILATKVIAAVAFIVAWWLYESLK